MQFVPTTLIAVIATLIVMSRGPVRGLWAFFALMPLGAAAALNLPALGGASIVLADAVAFSLFLVLMLQKGATARLLATMRVPSPGFMMLVLFLYATFATIFFPRFFTDVIDVFGIARIEGQIGIITVPLRPSTGNITQLLRFSLGAMIFFTLATAFRRTPDAHAVVVALAADVVVHVTLGVAEVASFNLGAAHVFDIIRTANYGMATNQVLAGMKRMIGGFPEASAFGYHTMGLFGFWLQYWYDRGEYIYARWMLLGTLVVLILSTSTSAYVGAVVFLCAFAVTNYSRVRTRDISKHVAWILAGIVAFLPLAIAAIVVAYQIIPEVTAYFDRMLFNKLSSDSGVERMSWNRQAFQNFLETGMIGAGLGSIRASSWIVACLASLGAVGTLLFFSFLISLARAPVPAERSETAIVVRALKMGCLALLMRAMITKSTPNLDLAFFAMAGLVAGISAGAFRNRRAIDPRRRLALRDAAVSLG